MVWAPQTSTGPHRTRAGLRRVCFTLQFDPARLDEYLDDHKTVWPEMQQALVSCGWHNYSLFCRRDGFAVGYFETDESFETACARMDALEVNQRWQVAMSKYTPKASSPIEGAGELSHYFYLGTDCEGGPGPASAPSPCATTLLAVLVGVGCGIILGARLRG